MIVFDDNFWWWFLMTKYSPGDSTFETLSTILTIGNLNSDNYSYLTINCDTGQHSQFLRCFIWWQRKLSRFAKSVDGNNILLLPPPSLGTRWSAEIRSCWVVLISTGPCWSPVFTLWFISREDDKHCQRHNALCVYPHWKAALRNFG